ncbi:hypothetical protein MMC09_000684 [Bachmanniomyces sp. S44760]|nr:hypothetical protein [Bachmanniomyces sp. S44760]
MLRYKIFRKVQVSRDVAASSQVWGIGRQYATAPSSKETNNEPKAETHTGRGFENGKLKAEAQDQQPAPKKDKTMAEQDEELRLKLEGISGEGGAAGLELENGKPVAMKRGVRDNMFRLI